MCFLGFFCCLHQSCVLFLYFFFVLFVVWLSVVCERCVCCCLVALVLSLCVFACLFVFACISYVFVCLFVFACILFIFCFLSSQPLRSRRSEISWPTPRVTRDGLERFCVFRGPYAVAQVGTTLACFPSRCLELLGMATVCGRVMDARCTW